MSGGDGTAAGGGEAEYETVRTSVWWDIENCPVPKSCDPHAIAKNITSSLVQMNYKGRVSISAYGDTNRIPFYLQHALSSTGIALNHVPAGVKDASDKKILVDMLFWAVDNPAPANYLLISGDRDFSNALHQLRMRRYNVLLAQPLKASHALVAAAKSVWLWTNLVAGGSPLPCGESTQPANVNNSLNSELSRNPISDPAPLTQPQFPSIGCFSYGNQKFNSDKDADSKFRGKYALKNPNQPMMTRASSAPVETQEIKNDDYSLPPENAPAKQFKKAPHEFFGSSEPVISSSKSSSNILPGELDNSGNTARVFAENAPNDYPRPSFAPPHNMFLPNPRNNWPHPVPLRPDVSRFSSTPAPSVPNTEKLSISLDSNYSQNSSNFCERFEFGNLPIPNGYPKGHSLQSSQPVFPDAPSNMHPSSFQFPPSSSTTVVGNSISGNGMQGGCLQPSEFVPGDIGVVLLALSSLKVEKIMPTEANIKDCIRFGDPRHRNIVVRKALDNAIEQNMVVMLNLGVVPLYTGKNERLWKCVNPLDGDFNRYPKPMWERIQKFLASAAGRPVIMTSQCRYEAALILKSMCLKDLALGEVLQILNMIITMKRWIFPHHSGWQPITISPTETDNDAGTVFGP